MMGHGATHCGKVGNLMQQQKNRLTRDVYYIRWLDFEKRKEKAPVVVSRCNMCTDTRIRV